MNMSQVPRVIRAGNGKAAGRRDYRRLDGGPVRAAAGLVAVLAALVALAGCKYEAPVDLGSTLDEARQGVEAVQAEVLSLDVSPETISREALGSLPGALPPAQCVLEIGQHFFAPLKVLNISGTVYAIFGDLASGDFYQVPLEFVRYSACGDLFADML